MLGAGAGLAAMWATGAVERPLGQILAGGAAFGIIAIPGTWLLGDEAMREVLRSVWARLRRTPRG